MICSLQASQSPAPLSIIDLSHVVPLSLLGHVTTFTVTSWSMYPTIHKGDQLELRAADAVQPEDVVVYRQQDVLVCHRVVSLEQDDAVRTCGDAAPGPGELVRDSDICGIVTAIIRRNTRMNVPGRPIIRPTPPIRKLVYEYASQVRHVLVQLLRSLLKRPIVRPLLHRIVSQWAQITVAHQAPLQAVTAISPSPGLNSPLQIALSPAASPPLNLDDKLWCRIRLGRYEIGLYHPASNRLLLRDWLKGIELEASILRLCAAPSLGRPSPERSKS
jgi:Peptidase S24-like